MNERMTLRIRNIRVDRMYGMRMGMVVDEFSDGLNVVHGPNAAGKTTLIRAVEALIWKDSPFGDSAVVEADLEIDGTSWFVSRQGPVVHWQREGVPHEPPSLPPADQRDRYQLLLPELLKAEKGELAEVVRLEAVGGLDLEQAGRDLGYSRISPQRYAVSKEAESRANRLRKIVDEQKALRRGKETLRDLESELDELRESEARYRYLSRLLEYLDAADKLRASVESISGFPEGMKRLQGDELEIIDKQRSIIKTAAGDIEEAQDAAATARGKIARNRLPEDGLGDGVLERLQRRVNDITGIARGIEDAEKTLAGEKKRAERLMKEIGAVVDAETARSIDITGIGEIADWARQAEKDRNRRQAAQEILTFLGEDEEGPDPDALSEAASALRAWLGAEGTGSPGSARRIRSILLATALLTLLAAIVLGVAIHTAAFVFILAALVQGWMAWTIDRTSSAGDSARHRQTFESTGIASPDGWTTQAVKTRLRELYRDISDARWSEAKAVKRAEIARMIEDTSSEDRLAAFRQRLAEETGIGPEPSEEEIVYLVERILSWREADASVEASAEQVRVQRKSLESALDELPAIIPDVDVERPETAAAAADMLISIQSARDAHSVASTELREAKGRVKSCEADIETAEEELRRVFDRAGLEPGELDELRRRIDRLDEYRSVMDAHRRLEGAVESERARLARSDQFEESDLDASHADIRRAADQAADEAGRIDDLTKRITETRTLMRQAEEGRNLESARADLESALEKVRGYRMSTLESNAGSIVVDYVQRRTRDQQLPDVLRLARKKFQSIAPRYRLDWDSTTGNFAAHDLKRNVRMGLEALSAGTRVQLLLSVRLAFIEHQEQGYRLPITLDETLANSDDDKAREIMHAVLEICRSDRQVFYCTAQSDEVGKWRGAVGSDHEESASFHRIQESIDGGANPVSRFAPEARSADRTAPPAPDGAAHSEYGGVLNVPSWTPRDPIGAAHAWFIVDDPEALHRLLSARLEFWGPARDVLGRGSADALGLSSGDVERILVLGDAASAWHEAWQEGRGMPVDAIAIGDCPSVSDTFRERVIELCEEVGGDGRELVERLHAGDVKRFHATKADELREWLIDRGYIDTADPLTRDQMWSRMLKRVSGRMEAAGVTFDDLDRLRSRLTPARRGEPSAE